MDLEDIMLSEVSQRKTNTVYFHLYVESKICRNKQIKQKQWQDTEDQLLVNSEEMGGKRGK